MASKPIENLMYEFLVEQKIELPAGTSIMPTPYDKRDGNYGIEIGDADTSMLPNGNENDVTEFDSVLALEIFARVEGADKTKRLPARQKVFDIKKSLVQLFEKFPNLDGRVCKIRILQQVRFYDDTRADKYSIERIPVVINPMNFRGE